MVRGSGDHNASTKTAHRKKMETSMPQVACRFSVSVFQQLQTMCTVDLMATGTSTQISYNYRSLAVRTTRPFLRLD
jgi:hypothetical protein